MPSNSKFTILIENIINNQDNRERFISWLNHIDNQKFESFSREDFCNLFLDFLKQNIKWVLTENINNDKVDKETKTVNNPQTSTPKANKKQNAPIAKSSQTFCLGDFLTQSQSKNKNKNKNSRRINPTQVSSTSDSKFEPTYFTGHKDNFVEERALLKKHRNIELNSSNIRTVESPKFHSNNLFLPQEDISNKLALDIFSEVYSILCKSNLIRDKLCQLNFILSIISSNSLNLSFHDSYFNSLQNCLYFAYKSMELSKLWILFDLTAIKSLLSNPRTEYFNSNLYIEMISKIGLQEKEFIMPLLEKKVIFEFDHESRSTFPHDNCFATFRKQRDSFYEIFISWEQQQHNPKYFETNLLSKVKSLLSLSKEPTNYFHLANLIKNQLIASCISSYFEKSQDIDSDLKETLKTENDDKISRLQQRFTKPQTYLSSKGITFPHFQEFFQKFFTSSSHIFLTHMRDVLIAEILHLDTNHFLGLEFQDSEHLVDPYTRGKYLKTVLTLKLLAKFLGLIIFMPYKTSLSLANNIIKSETNIRESVHPNFDINKYLTESIVHRRLVLTIPWVIEYLLMIDHASLSISYYKETQDILYFLYRFLPYFETIKITSDSTSMLISLSISWLFSQSIYEKTKLFRLKNALVLDKSPFADYINKETRSLDSLNLISHSSFKICCPFIEETKMRNLEYQFGNSKHITPIPAISVKPDDIQSTLEESFITTQPKSIRQTLNFIIDKVSSKIIRKITLTWWPEAKTQALKLDKLSTENLPKIELEGLRLFTEILNKNLPEFCIGNVRTSLSSLLPDDTSNVVMNNLVRISDKKIRDKLDTWFESNFNEAHRLNNIKKECEKLIKNQKKITQNVLPNCKYHSNEAMNPKNCILLMMNISSLIINQPDILSEQDILFGIKTAKYTCHFRKDLLGQICKRIGFLSIEQIILLVAYKPLFYNESLLKEYALFWKSLNHSFRTELFERIVSSRNLMILAHSNINSNDSWTKYGYFINYLLEKKFISPKKLESQCLSILRTEWPQGISLQFAQCLKSVIHSFKLKNKKNNSKFLLLLELVTDICADQF